MTTKEAMKIETPWGNGRLRAFSSLVISHSLSAGVQYESTSPEYACPCENFDFKFDHCFSYFSFWLIWKIFFFYDQEIWFKN